MNFFEIIAQTFAQSGFVAMTWQQGVMILVSFVLLYMAIKKGFEPLLLLPSPLVCCWPISPWRA